MRTFFDHNINGRLSESRYTKHFLLNKARHQGHWKLVNRIQWGPAQIYCITRLFSFCFVFWKNWLASIFTSPCQRDNDMWGSDVTGSVIGIHEQKGGVRNKMPLMHCSTRPMKRSISRTLFFTSWRASWYIFMTGQSIPGVCVILPNDENLVSSTWVSSRWVYTWWTGKWEKLARVRVHFCVIYHEAPFFQVLYYVEIPSSRA
jgi:hypothetical protein